MSLPDTIAIEPVSAATEEVRALVGELDEELSAHYSVEQRHGLPLQAIFQPHVHFFVARQGDVPMGCGGVALFADFAEVKRMYVRRSARGRGIAEVILERIEAEARTGGHSVLRLETGDRQLAAIRFYERRGFRRCSAFGVYAEMPPQAVAISVFYEKSLASL